MPDPVRAEFSGSTVLLTGVGADGQVGQAVARSFAEQGASLVLVDRTADHVDARVNELTRDGLLAAGYPCDLTDGAAVKSLVGRIREKHGDSIHALVHMAGGFAMSGPVAESTLDVWNRQIAINLTTAFITARARSSDAARRNGRDRVLRVRGRAARDPPERARRRTPSRRAACVALMRAIAAEERPNGVRANAVAPIVDSHGDERSRDGRQARSTSSANRSPTSSFFSAPTRRARSPAVVPIA